MSQNKTQPSPAGGTQPALIIPAPAGNSRRSYGILFFLNGFPVWEPREARPGDRIRSEYLGGNAASQAGADKVVAEMERLGSVKSGHGRGMTRSEVTLREETAQ